MNKETAIYWQRTREIEQLETQIALLKEIVAKGVWGQHRELFGGWRIAHMSIGEQKIINSLDLKK